MKVLNEIKTKKVFAAEELEELNSKRKLMTDGIEAICFYTRKRVRLLTGTMISGIRTDRQSSVETSERADHRTCRSQSYRKKG